MPRKAHPQPDIEKALTYAEQNGWKIEISNSHAHAWGKMKCPYNNKECRCGEFCLSSIWSTPRNPYNHAKQIYRIVNRCIYTKESNERNK
jgi:hypothetical protein